MAPARKEEYKRDLSSAFGVCFSPQETHRRPILRVHRLGAGCCLYVLRTATEIERLSAARIYPSLGVDFAPDVWVDGSG